MSIRGSYRRSSSISEVCRRENLFDIPKTIVTKVLKEGERTLTDDFIRFSEHTGLKSHFLQCQAGHEKGNVESNGGYHLTQLGLVPVPRF